jgi:3-isopropylmalate dehydrogenase
MYEEQLIRSVLRMNKSEFRIAVLPGDGIGIEVMDACLAVLDVLQSRFGHIAFNFRRLPGGAGTYRDTGVALPDSSMAEAKQADVILFGAMGLPNIRYPDGTEIAPQVTLRFGLDLYAGVRPVKAIRGVGVPLVDPRAQEIDFVIIREQAEGLFASWGGKGVFHNDDIAIDKLVITRNNTARIADFALRLAQRRLTKGGKGRVTCVDKANAFQSLAFFRKVFDERAKAFADVASDHAYVDAVALNLVKMPWEYDVLVTENIFGDILSDLAAALIGGMGMAPSGDIGEKHAVFQPCHGTAPDIAGTGKANPVAMFRSAVMMLDYLAEQHGFDECQDAADCLSSAIEIVLAQGRAKPIEIGGSDGTRKITEEVILEIQK